VAARGYKGLQGVVTCKGLKMDVKIVRALLYGAAKGL